MTSDFESDSISTNPASEEGLPPDGEEASTTKTPRILNRWSQDEDELLQMLVHQLGTEAWSDVSGQMNSSRTARQCRDRWYSKLDQNMCRDPWTPEEDAVLMDRHREFGNKWKKISEALPHRTHQSIRNRYQVLSRREEKNKGVGGQEQGQELQSSSSFVNPKPNIKRKSGATTTKGGGGRGKKVGIIDQKEGMGMEVCTKFEPGAEPHEDESLWTMSHNNWLVANQRTPRAFYSLPIDEDFLPPCNEPNASVDPRTLPIRFPPPQVFMDFFSSPRHAATTIPQEMSSD